MTRPLAAARRKPQRPPAVNKAARSRSAITEPRPQRIDDKSGLAKAVAALLAQDPLVVGRLLEIGGMPSLRRGRQGFAGLAAIIVSQQVSVASADAIFARLLAQLDPFDQHILAGTADPVLQGCGLSRPKIRTLRAVAAALIEGRLELDALADLSPEDAHAKLVAVHGIGPWSADLFLLSCLGHPDAWPSGDLALQEAARMALGLRKRPDKAKLESIGERWRPWRAVAARMLWTYYRHVKSRRGVAAGMID